MLEIQKIPRQLGNSRPNLLTLGPIRPPGKENAGKKTWRWEVYTRASILVSGAMPEGEQPRNCNIDVLNLVDM
jgi:hypothetical protein